MLNRTYSGKMLRLSTKALLIAITFSLYEFKSQLNIEFISWYSLLVFITIFMLYFYKKDTLNFGYLFVLLALALYNFGQLYIRLFIPGKFLPIFYEFSVDTIKLGFVYSLTCIQILDLTFDFSSKRYIHCEKKINSDSQLRYSSTRIGLFIYLILLPIVFINQTLKLFASLNYGYMNLYSYSGDSKFFEPALLPYLNILYINACILIISSEIGNTLEKRAATFSLLIFGVLNYISGSRSTFLSIAFVLIIIWLRNMKSNLNFSKMLKLGFLGFSLVYMAVFMSYYRLNDKDFSGIKEAIQYVNENNPIVELMVEMGVSLKPQLYIIEMLENSDLRLGESYSNSFYLLVPNINGFLGPIHPASTKTALAQWLMSVKNMSHGPGFSIIAESYYNFGIFGSIVFVFWGLFFSKILSNTGSPKSQFISLASVPLLMILIRGTFGDFIRGFFYLTVILYLIVQLVKDFWRKY